MKRSVFLFLLSVMFCAPAFGYDEAEAEKMAKEKHRFETVTTKEGLKFSIPSDMPIERKDGLVQPIPFEEYLYIKFKQIEGRMTSLEKQITELERKILSRLDQLEKKFPSQPPAEPTPAA